MAFVIAYLDSSVLLRIIFGEPNPLDEWRELHGSLDIRTLDEHVLDVAAQPLPTPLTTLDAIHLATAIIARASQPDGERPILFATHDKQLATAARAMHFEVIGA